MPRYPKPCTFDDCTNDAAFSTNTKPAWCVNHILQIVNNCGFTAMEVFPGKPSIDWLMRCNDCGISAHYRLNYIIDKVKYEKPCRACYWLKWNRDQARLLGGHLPEWLPDVVPSSISLEERRNPKDLAEAMGYEFLGACFQDTYTPYLVKCRTCAKVSAQRIGDIGWGCQCRVNSKRQTASPREPEATEVESPFIDPNNERLPRISQELLSQFVPEKNPKIDIIKLSPTSVRRVVWTDPNCGHEWIDTPANRNKRFRIRCPQCQSILDSFGYHYPELASEWAPTNPTSPWHVRPTGATRGFIPNWICPQAGHVWSSPTASRIAGALCPECAIHGKSRIELRFFDEAAKLWPSSKSGPSSRNPQFQYGVNWRPDIEVLVDDDTKLVIEYDGSFWHKDKAKIDKLKSLDFLNAGYHVIRLREYPLFMLDIDHIKFMQIVVRPEHQPGEIIRAIASWVTSRDTA